MEKEENEAKWEGAYIKTLFCGSICLTGDPSKALSKGPLENTDGQNSGEVHQGVELRAPRTNSDASLRAGDL